MYRGPQYPPIPFKGAEIQSLGMPNATWVPSVVVFGYISLGINLAVAFVSELIVKQHQICKNP
jgi:hypothetical protein